MKRLKDTFMALALGVCTAIPAMLVGCSDDPGVENYYTSTKEYAADFLKNREEYSDFVKILERATGEKENLRLMNLLSTYGSYTVFAPTNDAVKTYLEEKHAASVEDLSKEDCDTIALNSIIEGRAYFTSDQSSDSYGKTNMLDLYMTISSVEETDENGDPQLVMYI
ncbi:MAG: fasciclin domain-containing protein, partial [Bacteroidaceae bacterium]|nr:fasciclin domain-containing protein [Bacteroidaceae bacterium]